jgi:hypothetical protein
LKKAIEKKWRHENDAIFFGFTGFGSLRSLDLYGAWIFADRRSMRLRGFSRFARGRWPPSKVPDAPDDGGFFTSRYSAIKHDFPQA